MTPPVPLAPLRPETREGLVENDRVDAPEHDGNRTDDRACHREPEPTVARSSRAVARPLAITRSSILSLSTNVPAFHLDASFLKNFNVETDGWHGFDWLAVGKGVEKGSLS